MIIKRKCFGFLDRMKGNPELKSKMMRAISSGRIDPSVPSDLPDDLRRYMTFLIDNGIEKSREIISNGSGGVVFAIFPYKKLIEQYNGEVPFGVRSTNENRIVLMQTTDYTISYSIDDSVYELREEANSIDLIGRFTNRLFRSSEKPVFISKFLKDVIMEAFTTLVTIHY